MSLRNAAKTMHTELIRVLRTYDPYGRTVQCLGNNDVAEIKRAVEALIQVYGIDVMFEKVSGYSLEELAEILSRLPTGVGVWEMNPVQTGILNDTITILRDGEQCKERRTQFNVKIGQAYHGLMKFLEHGEWKNSGLFGPGEQVGVSFIMFHLHRLISEALVAEKP